MFQSSLILRFSRQSAAASVSAAATRLKSDSLLGSTAQPHRDQKWEGEGEMPKPNRSRPLVRRELFEPSDEVTAPAYVPFEQPANPKFLRVALMGMPNTGKSTLLNMILGEKVTAVSPKAQTTRSPIVGIYTPSSFLKPAKPMPFSQMMRKSESELAAAAATPVRSWMDAAFCKDHASTQVVFYDTPGILNRGTMKDHQISSLVESAWSTVKSSDAVLLMVDASKHSEMNRHFHGILRDLRNNLFESSPDAGPDDAEHHRPSVYLVFNKVDLVTKKRELLSMTELIHQKFSFAPEADADTLEAEVLAAQLAAAGDEQATTEESDHDGMIEDLCALTASNSKPISASSRGDPVVTSAPLTPSPPTPSLFKTTFYVSAKSGSGVQALVNELVSSAHSGTWWFSPEQKTYQSDLNILHETVRERVYCYLNQEIPYLIEQETLGWTPMRDGSLRIDHDLIVPHIGVKKIVIGDGGRVIRAIGSAARQELEKKFRKRVHLFMNVRVREL